MYSKLNSKMHLYNPDLNLDLNFTPTMALDDINSPVSLDLNFAPTMTLDDIYLPSM